MSHPYIKCLKSERTESGIMFGQFLINSLEPGQGLTIGNLLRRVLLGDLGGTSITGIRLAGAKDEFSIITGVREDILEILLNLKGVIVKSRTTKPHFGYLKIKGPAIITANSIQLPPELEIINPNHYIATIATENTLEIEFKFDYGTGYKLAGQNTSKRSGDFLEIDAIFMPVKKVDFKIENIYDSTNNINERLIIEVWTNGSLKPEDAIYIASQSIIDLFNSIIENKCPPKNPENINKIGLNILEQHTNIAIEELQLSVRAYNCLKRAQINTIGDLLEYSPEKLQELKNFGRKSSDEVFMTLKNKLGIILK